jgi:hypothetical protein
MIKKAISLDPINSTCELALVKYYRTWLIVPLFFFRLVLLRFNLFRAVSLPEGAERVSKSNSYKSTLSARLDQYRKALSALQPNGRRNFGV